MKISFLKALLAINPKAQASISGVAGEEILSTLTWENGTIPIDVNLILNKQSELQALEDVYENRREEYGTIVSQLDEIYHSGLDSWKARLANIKAKYPKE
jgi:hypothetical protein